MISKSMHQTIQYTEEIRDAFEIESKDSNADEARRKAEWARMMAVEMKKQGFIRTRSVAQANGEVVPSQTEGPLHDTITIPDLAAVEASIDRSRLLLQSGTDVAAMALDAANSIQAGNSLERMLAHQLAAAHKLVMEQMGQVSCEHDAAAQAKRLNAASRCMAVYQQGLLALHKVRQNGQQRIMVQYVNVSNSSQPVIRNFERRANERPRASCRKS
jgi:hypothetical protein